MDHFVLFKQVSHGLDLQQPCQYHFTYSGQCRGKERACYEDIANPENRWDRFALLRISYQHLPQRIYFMCKCGSYSKRLSLFAVHEPLYFHV